jgi:hypothetical protein
MRRTRHSRGLDYHRTEETDRLMASEESLRRYVNEAQVNLTHREGQMKIQNDMELLEAHDT